MVSRASRSCGDVPLARDGHDVGAGGVVGGVEREGEAGAGGLGGEAADGGLDAGGGDGHAGLGQSEAVDEEADGGHEVVVVEEGLALAHEDKVDAGGIVITAGAGELDVVAVEDGGDLAGDLAGGEIAADAEFGGEAELAVDGAADLRRDADGGAAEGASLPAAWVARVVGVVVRAVACAVAVGHPDGLDGFAVGELDEVALGTVHGACGGGEEGEADGVGLGEAGAEAGRQGGECRRAR